MKRNDAGGCRLCTLRGLREERHANEVARLAAIGRLKRGVVETFSVGALLLFLVRRCAPEGAKRYVESLFSFLKQ